MILLKQFTHIVKIMHSDTQNLLTGIVIIEYNDLKMRLKQNKPARPRASPLPDYASVPAPVLWRRHSCFPLVPYGSQHRATCFQEGEILPQMPEPSSPVAGIRSWNTGE